MVPVIIIFFPQNSLLSLWPSRPPGAIRLLPPSLPRGGKHHGHLHGHPVPWHRLLCQQRRLEGHLGSHPKGGSAHCVLWGAQGVGEGPGENDPGEKNTARRKIKGRIQVGKANTGFKKAFGSWAKKTGLEYNKAKLGGRNGAKLSFKIADKMVFSKVTAVSSKVTLSPSSGERGTWFWSHPQLLQCRCSNQPRCPRLFHVPRYQGLFASHRTVQQ